MNLDTVENGMRYAGVCVEDAEDRNKWRCRTMVADPEQLGRKTKEKKGMGEPKKIKK